MSVRHQVGERGLLQQRRMDVRRPPGGEQRLAQVGRHDQKTQSQRREKGLAETAHVNHTAVGVEPVKARHGPGAVTKLAVVHAPETIAGRRKDQTADVASWAPEFQLRVNSAVVHNGYAGAGANTVSADPTNLAARHGFQYDPLTAGSGLGNVYVNAKWLFKLSGVYGAPYGVNVSAFYNARQGYPFEASVQSPSRLNGAGIATILLDGVGENRLPDFQNVDVHVDRAVRIGTVRLVPGVNIFNLLNANTVQALQRTQNASTANNISAVVAPRVIRAGIKLTW
jgi:hypothetical protein